MVNEKIVLAFSKVREDMDFLRSEIESVKKSSKKSSSDKGLLEYNSKVDSTLDKLAKQIITIENDYKDEIDKTHRILGKLKGDFESKLETEINFLKADFEEKLADVDRNNSYEGEDLY